MEELVCKDPREPWAQKSWSKSEQSWTGSSRSQPRMQGPIMKMPVFLAMVRGVGNYSKSMGRDSRVLSREVTWSLGRFQVSPSSMWVCIIMEGLEAGRPEVEKLPQRPDTRSCVLGPGELWDLDKGGGRCIFPTRALDNNLWHVWGTADIAMVLIWVHCQEKMSWHTIWRKSMLHNHTDIL